VYNKGNLADSLIAGAIAYEVTGRQCSNTVNPITFFQAIRLYNQYMEKGGQVNNYVQAQGLLYAFALISLS